MRILPLDGADFANPINRKLAAIMKQNKKFWIFLTLTLLWCAFIFTRSMQAGEESAAESGWVLAFVQTIFPGITEHTVRKLAHFSEFLLLGAMSTLTQFQTNQKNPTLSLLFGLLCAMADETIQLTVPGRSGRVQDVWIDFAGVTVAVTATFLFRHFHQKKSK